MLQYKITNSKGSVYEGKIDEGSRPFLRALAKEFAEPSESWPDMVEDLTKWLGDSQQIRELAEMEDTSQQAHIAGECEWFIDLSSATQLDKKETTTFWAVSFCEPNMLREDFETYTCLFPIQLYKTSERAKEGAVQSLREDLRSEQEEAKYYEGEYLDLVMHPEKLELEWEEDGKEDWTAWCEQMNVQVHVYSLGVCDE